MRKISVKKYAQVLYELTRDLPKEQIKVEIDKFLQLVARNKDVKKLDKIFKAFDDYAKKQESIADVQLITARKLSSEQKESLQSQLKKEHKFKVINFLELVDASLLGGFILKIDDTILDASLKTKLESLRTEMKKG